MPFDPPDSTSSGTYTFSFAWSDIGVISGATKTFRFETTYIKTTGQRSLESFESLSGTTGFGTVTFGNYDTFPTPVPETTKPALAIFGGLALGVGVFARLRRFLASRANSGSRSEGG